MVMTYQLIISLFLAGFDLILIFAGGSLLSLLFVLAILLMLIVWGWSFISSINRHKETRLMNERSLPEIVSKYGKFISVHGSGTFVDPDRTIIFERENTMFEAKIKRLNMSISNMTFSKTDYEVRFNLPNLRETFDIQNKPTFLKNSAKYSLDYQPVIIPAIPADIILHSFNPQFLVSLLEKKHIVAEIYKYLNTDYKEFRIAFEDKAFVITWNFSEFESTQIEAEKFEQICQTAVVFYDELSKK